MSRNHNWNMTKFIHEGNYVAEVTVTLILADDDWAPYLSVEDAQKLDAVRWALRDGNISAATRYGKIFKLLPVAA